jgi:xanthine dehydrogenase YagS FAD-binding subunit
MRPFEYARPRELARAVAMLAQDAAAAMVLAGGCDLLPLLRDGVVAAQRLVDLRALPGLAGVKATDEGLRIGALTTLEDLAAEAGLAFDYPAVAAAAGRIGSPQLRGMATLGGNLCQRPRSAAFRAGAGLLPAASGTPVGDEDSALLGGDPPPLFVQPSTLAPLLGALGAKLVLAGPEGERRIDLLSFYRMPQAAGEREHDLRAGEILTTVLLPQSAGRRVGCYEVRARGGLEGPLASASVALELQGERVGTARIVLGQVAPVPWLAVGVGEALEGKALDRKLIRLAAEACFASAKPAPAAAWRVPAARAAVERALLAAAGLG